MPGWATAAIESVKPKRLIRVTRRKLDLPDQSLPAPLLEPVCERCVVDLDSFQTRPGRAAEHTVTFRARMVCDVKRPRGSGAC